MQLCKFINNIIIVHPHSGRFTDSELYNNNCMCGHGRYCIEFFFFFFVHINIILSLKTLRLINDNNNYAVCARGTLSECNYWLSWIYRTHIIIIIIIHRSLLESLCFLRAARVFSSWRSDAVARRTCPPRWRVVQSTGMG